jgi:heptosyltransferase-2
MTNSPPRIFVKGLNWVGDALMATPALAHLRHCHPQAHIALMVRPWVAAVYEHNPDINELIVMDEAASPWKFMQAVHRVRRGGFQLGIALPNSVRSALLLKLGGIPTRVGFRFGARGLLLNRLVEPRDELKQVHQVYYYLELLKSLCAPPPEIVRMKLIPGELEQAEMGRLLATLGLDRDQPLVGIAPGSINSNAKRWLPERFAQMADWLVNECECEVLLLGSAREKDVVDRVAARAHARVHNLAGQVNLAQMLALTARFKGLICNDAGAMHIGAALGIPTIAVFGPTEWTTTYPFSPTAMIVRKDGIDCAPCMLRECPIDHRCMNGVTVEMVQDAFTKLLKTAARQKSDPVHI